MMPDHIHLLLSIPPKYNISSFMGYFKGKIATMIFDKHANLQYKFGNKHFLSTGYYVDAAGRNKKIIQEYIQNQFKEDLMEDRLSFVDTMDSYRKK